MLGALIQPDGQPGPAIRRRMEVAIALYHSGAAPRLLLSGGGPQGVAEAEVMRCLAVAAGVPETALLLETASANTVENALECARLLAADSAAAVLLVTDAAHALRARVLFRMAGLSVCGVVSAPARPADLAQMAVKEIVKLPISVVRMIWRTLRRKNVPGMPRI